MTIVIFKDDGKNEYGSGDRINVEWPPRNSDRGTFGEKGSVRKYWIGIQLDTLCHIILTLFQSRIEGVSW